MFWQVILSQVKAAQDEMGSHYIMHDQKLRSGAGTRVGTRGLDPMLRELLAATARGATKVKQLSPKRGPRNYYKGKGAASVGHHTKKGQNQGACETSNCPGNLLSILCSV